MLLILYIQIVQCFHYTHNLTTNETLTITTNVTDLAPSIILLFYLPTNRDAQIGCFVSKYDNIESNIDITNSTNLENEEQYSYDFHSIQSNSDKQLIEVNYQDQLFVKCESTFQTNQIKLEMTYLEDYLNDNCINQCQGYNLSDIYNTSQCINNDCVCQTNQLGNFCQLSARYLLSGQQISFSINYLEWKFFYYQFKSYELILDTSFYIDNPQIYYSIVLEDEPQQIIPNIEIAFLLDKQIVLSDYLQVLLDENNYESNILYIGLFNNQNQTITGNLTVTSTNSSSSDTLERNKIVIIIVGSIIGGLLCLTIILSIIKTRRLQAQTITIRQQEQQQQQQVRQRKIHKNHGFTKEFIAKYFASVSFNKLEQHYPQIKQFDNCVICLEEIKNAEKKNMRKCSITPCFHVFHFECLQQWLHKQKACPFCRTQYSKKQIQQLFPWIKLEQKQINNEIILKETNDQNKQTNQTNQTMEVVLNESVQDLVQKQVALFP